MAVAFSQEVFDEICGQIADGKSLRSICKKDDMPASSTIFRWLAEKDELAEQYARAREAQADALFDEILDIADQYDQTEEKLGGTDHINRARLRIDARKWMAGKLRPKKYGDKLDVEANVEASGEIIFKNIIHHRGD